MRPPEKNPNSATSIFKAGSQINLEQSGLRNNRLLTVLHHTHLERLRFALGLGRRLFALAHVAIHSAFTTINLSTISVNAVRHGCLIYLHVRIA